MLARIVQAPLAYPRVQGDIRRALVHRFPYAIYYHAMSDEIVVLGVSHGRRHPLSELAREGERSDTVNADRTRKYFKMAAFPLPRVLRSVLPNATAVGYFRVQAPAGESRAADTGAVWPPAAPDQERSPTSRER